MPSNASKETGHRVVKNGSAIQSERGHRLVLEEFRTFFGELDQRVKVTIAGIGIQNWSQSLTWQYNTLYVRALGANPVALGALNSINTAVSSIVSVPVGWVAERYSVKWVMLPRLSCIFISASIYAVAGNCARMLVAIPIRITVPETLKRDDQ